MLERSKLNLEGISARLKELRTAILKTSLIKMSRTTGVLASGISMMERGSMKPSAIYLQRLAQLFDVDINWVLTGKGGPFKADIEMKLDQGDNIELIKEMFAACEKIPAIKFELLNHFINIRSDKPGIFKPAGKKK